MAKLTGDQFVSIQNDLTYQNRVGAVLKAKAQYWLNAVTTTRADVNRRMQKRKRLAKQISSNPNTVQQFQKTASDFWLAWYQAGTDPAVLDVSNLPAYDTIFNAFDATYDSLAGYLANDENETEIDW